ARVRRVGRGGRFLRRHAGETRWKTRSCGRVAHGVANFFFMTGASPRDDADVSARAVPDREVPTRDELREQLLTHRIAGPVATPREDNLRKYAMFAERDPYHLFGLEPERVWTLADVVKLMAERAGVSGDLKH